jgi:hypothetical protein
MIEELLGEAPPSSASRAGATDRVRFDRWSDFGA